MTRLISTLTVCALVGFLAGCPGATAPPGGGDNNDGMNGGDGMDGPMPFAHIITLDGERITVNFTSFSNRGPNFAVLEQQADGTFVNRDAGAVPTYLGTVADRPGALAAGVRRADGTVLARVGFEDGVEWIDDGTTVSTIPFDPFAPQRPEFVVRDGGAGSVIYSAEIGIDLTHDQVMASWGTTQQAVEIAELSVMAMNTIYLRDTSILNRIERIIVRMSNAVDPYAGQVQDNDLLDTVRLQWDDVLPMGNHDAAMVVTPILGGAGLANVGVIGFPGYGANGSSGPGGEFSRVARHELGHNWALDHFDGGTPEGPTMNSGNSLAKMSGPEIEVLLRHRDDRLMVLDNLGNLAAQVPPRAADDSIDIRVGAGNVNLAVLANDNDANGSVVSIMSFDAQTRSGLTVTQAGDQLVVQAPDAFSADPDSFSYRIRDTDGMTSTAVVHLRIVNP